jgi:hypothetical protein
MSPVPAAAPVAIPLTGFKDRVIFRNLSFLGRFQTNDYCYCPGLGTDMTFIRGMGKEVERIFETEAGSNSV